MKKIALFCAVIWITVLALAVGCKAQEVTPTEVHSVGFVQARDSADGYATVYVPSDREAKVLLLADPQLDPTEKYSIVGSYNELTLIFLDKFLDVTRPDLVLVAGDVTMTGFLNSWSYFCQIADIFEAKRIPWSFVFGNHDCEKEYVSIRVDIDSGLGQMTKANFIEEVQAHYEYCLIYSAECEDGDGNHVVNVRNTRGQLLNTFVGLDCAYDEEDGYSHVITQAQTDYYEGVVCALSAEEGRTIPTVVYTHVALPQTFVAYHEIEAGIGDSTYYYGQLLGGDYSAYVDRSPFFDKMLELGSTKAVFFGHHHGNDISLEYQGIRLSFIPHSGMSHEYRTDHSIDYQPSGWDADTVFDFTEVDLYGDHRGGVMVTLDQNATYTFAPVHAASVIPDYADWAIDYDAVASDLIATRGPQSVIRGK